jgi:hypothetical protein
VTAAATGHTELAGGEHGEDSTIQPAAQLAYATRRLESAAGLATRPVMGAVPGRVAALGQGAGEPSRVGVSLVSAAGLYVVLLVIAFVTTGGALGARGAGALFSPCLIAGIVTGAVAWSVRSRWPIWLYPLVVLGIAIGFTVLSSIGRIAPSS